MIWQRKSTLLRQNLSLRARKNPKKMKTNDKTYSYGNYKRKCKSKSKNIA